MVPEWEVVQRVVQESQQEHRHAWEGFAECREVEAYTDGSCPIKNPGGPAGFAAILVGYNESIDGTKPERPEPRARLDLAGYIPARRTEPPTSNNRSEIAGILAACEALRQLGLRGYRLQHVTIWSDSQYAVNCATGVWKRKKNTDLWPIFDRIDREVRTWAADFSLRWVRGHGGNLYNEAADVLATRAAFDFDLGRYNAFRAAQQATGKEMPGKAGGVQAMAKTTAVHTPTTAVQVPMPMPGVPDANRPDSITIPATPTANPANWLDGADYRLVLYTRVKKGDNALGDPHTGEYRLWARDGRSRTRSVRHEGGHANDEAEYLTLIEALTDILDRITKSGRDTRSYSLLIYSRQELMVKQLRGEYKVKAPALQQVYRQATALLARFKSATLAYRDAASIREMLEE